jgi:uncharacterized membrane protein
MYVIRSQSPPLAAQGSDPYQLCQLPQARNCCPHRSPAINDPTTAVLALDQIHYLLREVGIRRLDTGVVKDRGGNVRLVYATPDWEDFVQLRLTEIRQYGANSVQITRRLRALLENLTQSLPPRRIAALQVELRQLDLSIERSFADPTDRDRAGIPDSRGLGGGTKVRA